MAFIFAVTMEPRRLITSPRGLGLLCLLAIWFAVAPDASAQTFRVAGEMANGVRTYIEVYEYDYVSEKPSFPGGDEMLMHYINEERRYPAKAYKEGVQGRVTCSFVVNTDGSVSHVRVLRGVEQSLNQEAVRLIRMMPTWRPGKLDGQTVPVRVIYAVAFRK